MFDLGPQPPVRPTKPQVLLDEVTLPAGAEGNSAIEPETRRYAERYRDYLRAMDSYETERAKWERESGGGAIEISTSQADIVECGRGRYVAVLPPDVKLGPRSGTNRVVHS
jgi:hypothetical protein